MSFKNSFVGVFYKLFHDFLIWRYLLKVKEFSSRFYTILSSMFTISLGAFIHGYGTRQRTNMLHVKKGDGLWWRSILFE